MKRPLAGKQPLLAHGLLIAVTIVWGGTFPLVKAALQDASPLAFNLARMSLATAILYVVNRAYLKRLSSRQVRLCALAGLFLATGYELQTTGLTMTTPSKSAFLTGLVVVLVPILSIIPGIRIADTPRPHGLAFVGALLAFFGIVLLTSKPGAGLSLLDGMHMGELLSLLCAVAFALHLLTLARSASLVPARVLGALQIAFAALVMLICLPLQPHARVHPTKVVLFALLITAVFATAAAFTIQSWAQQYLPPSHTALILTLEPVFASLISITFLHEHLGSRAIAGAGLILTGIVLAELGPTVLSQTGILPVEP